MVFAFALLAVGRAGAASQGELIKHGWSGHPVSFALLTEGGHQCIAYSDAERRQTVVARKIGDEKWIRVQPPGTPSAHSWVSTPTRWDTDAAAAMRVGACPMSFLL